MKTQKTVIGQLLDFLPREDFQEIVDRYKGDFKTHKLSCWGQFVSLFYAQLRGRDSLRDIEVGLETQLNKLYHLGMVGCVKRSTLADANEKRDYRIYQETFQLLLKKCQMLGKRTFDFGGPLLALDSSVITVCYSLFPWAKYSQTKGALKLHMRYDIDNGFPEFVCVEDGKSADIRVARTLTHRPDSILVFDRGYNDYTWFKSLHDAKVSFVTRLKSPFTLSVIGQHPVAKETGVLSDKTVHLYAARSHRTKVYTDPVRLVTYFDHETQKLFHFLTNNFTWPAETVALIYKQRWKIELFFKWIKQHLKIKTFIGTSKNAVLTQLWIAFCVYLILWFIKHQTRYRFPLLRLARILNEAAFERVHLLEILSLKQWSDFPSLSSTQMPLFSSV